MNSKIDEFELAKLATRPSDLGAAAAGCGFSGQLRMQALPDH
jgi:hypothetical protein